MSLTSAFPRRPPATDVALALLFAAAALLEVWVGGVPGPTAAKLVVALATTLPLAWRTTGPVWVVLATTGAYALGVKLGVPHDEPLVPHVAPLIAIYSLGATGSAPGTVLGGAGAFAAYSFAAAQAPDASVGDFLLAALMVLGSLTVGRAVAVMGFETDMLEAKAETAVAEERARIARELHDVIGHSISVMGVQAGAVRRRLRPEQGREQEALLAVERVGRDAVEEMQRLLGFLRSHNGEVGPATQLNRERVEDLVGELRRSGLDIDLRMEGELDGLPAGRALAGYRILQEALTNVLRHAPGAHVTAVVRRAPGAVTIEVADDGGSGQTSVRGGGHGLPGMRERAELYGGSLEAGPRAEGGFQVLARLPTGPV